VNYRLVITAEARIDIAEAVRWYEERSPGLGRRFFHALAERLRAIRADPCRPSGFGRRRIRKSRVRKFPYAVYYEVRGEEIRIHAVFHGARSPRMLIQRLP